MKTVSLVGDLLHIKFPYDPELVALVRSLPDRRWNAAAKEWTAPADLTTAKQLGEWGFSLSKEVEEWRNQQLKSSSVSDIDFFRLSPLLMGFQRDGIRFIEQHQGRALIGDEMGLGKTAQALSWLRLHPELRPAVIICPASIKINWEREIRLWMDEQETVQILFGTDIAQTLFGNIIIVNYDILPNDTIADPDDPKHRIEIPRTGWHEYLSDIKPKVVICDEAHNCKSRSTRRTKAVKELCKGVPHILMLTGTPIVNRPAEAFNMLNIISPARFPSFFHYAKEFCGAFRSRWGWDFSGASNLDKLHEKLQHIMVRRLKSEVLQDLPEKRRAIVPLEITNRKEYQRAEEDFVGWLHDKGEKIRAESASRAEALASIEGLKQLTISGKLDTCLDWIADFLEAGEKLIVFATHKRTIEAVMQRFGDLAVKVDGSVTGEDRQLAVDRFQTDDSVRLFVGNIQAAGVGITLTAASNVAFLELGWSPGLHEQAEDRAHRIGQRDSVTIWYLIAQGTIEERICKLLDSKRKVLSRVLDGGEIENGGGIFETLLEEIKGEEDGN